MNRGDASGGSRSGARSIELDAIQTAVAALGDLLQSGAGANARINYARRLDAELEKVADLVALSGRKREKSELHSAGQAHRFPPTVLSFGVCDLKHKMSRRAVEAGVPMPKQNRVNPFR